MLSERRIGEKRSARSLKRKGIIRRRLGCHGRKFSCERLKELEFHK